MPLDILERNGFFRETLLKGLDQVKDQIPGDQFLYLKELVSLGIGDDKMAYFQSWQEQLCNNVVFTKKYKPEYIRDNNGYLIEKSRRNFIPLFPDSYNPIIEHTYIRYVQVMSIVGRFLVALNKELAAKIDGQYLLKFLNRVQDILNECNKNNVANSNAA